MIIITLHAVNFHFTILSIYRYFRLYMLLIVNFLISLALFMNDDSEITVTVGDKLNNKVARDFDFLILKFH